MQSAVAARPREGWRYWRRLRQAEIRAKCGDCQQRDCSASEQYCFHGEPRHFGLLHRQPQIQERCIVARSADAGSVEPVVPGVLQPDTRIEPRPSRSDAAYERDIGDLGDPAVAVRTEAAGKSAVQGRIRIAPGIEVLAGEHDPIVITCLLYT